MKCTEKLKIKAIVRKVSQSENVYHEITLEESVVAKNSENEVIVRDWNRCYYPKDLDTNQKEDLIGKEVEVTLVFYPVKRQVGDQVFTNINCHIESIEGVNQSND